MLSPALDPDKLNYEFNKAVAVTVLEEVVRQRLDSGILFNATQLREQIAAEDPSQFTFSLKGYTDVIRLQDGDEFLESLSQALHEDKEDAAILIVRSNKRANQYNRAFDKGFFSWNQILLWEIA